MPGERPTDEIAKRRRDLRDLGRESFAERQVARNDPEEEDRFSGLFEVLGAQSKGELMGGEALRFLEIGQRPEDEGPGRAVRRDGIDEDHIPAAVTGDDGHKIFGDVLGVKDPNVRPSRRLPDGAGEPGSDPVVAAQGIADKDEARGLLQEIDKPGGGGGIENRVLPALYTPSPGRLYRERPGLATGPAAETGEGGGPARGPGRVPRGGPPVPRTPPYITPLRVYTISSVFCSWPFGAAI